MLNFIDFLTLLDIYINFPLISDHLADVSETALIFYMFSGVIDFLA